jgi:hypothetical protein
LDPSIGEDVTPGFVILNSNDNNETAPIRVLKLEYLWILHAIHPPTATYTLRVIDFAWIASRKRKIFYGDARCYVDEIDGYVLNAV